jgi:hypothetical protein
MTLLAFGGRSQRLSTILASAGRIVHAVRREKTEIRRLTGVARFVFPNTPRSLHEKLLKEVA